ncbi:MAG: DegT/DnrJ/EryC1/StrS family aminotransferase [bacterium]|nr:DegT/DnrJ/EryC1/StrS family aminotransferase [bacterium]
MTNRDKKFIPVCEPTLLGNEQTYVAEAMETGWISSAGKFIPAFEEAFAAYCGVKYGVAVCNGTDAIHLALVALGIGPGDEVIIPDFTMIASAFTVCYTGAKPVFVDAEPYTWNIDPARIKEKVTSQTKAIMPVHIYGHPCEMESILEIASKYGLFVIEDAAEAHGAEYKGKKAGDFGDISAFSFFANKNITTGEGGMVVTNNKELYNRARYYKNLCFPLDAPRTYLHENIGFNYRMSNLHAAVGLAQVEKADEYRAMRIRSAHLYRKYLCNVSGITLQPELPGCLNVYWMNGVLVTPGVYRHTRDELVAYLKTQGIDTRNFFIGMHRQPSLKKFGCNMEGDYPVSDNLATNGFYLPSASHLTSDQIRFISEQIIEFKKKK